MHKEGLLCWWNPCGSALLQPVKAHGLAQWLSQDTHALSSARQVGVGAPVSVISFCPLLPTFRYVANVFVS